MDLSKMGLAGVFARLEGWGRRWGRGWTKALGAWDRVDGGLGDSETGRPSRCLPG